MRKELQYTPGYWWHRKESGLYFRHGYLGDWDSLSNYEQVTDAQKEEYDALQEVEPLEN